MTAVVLLFWSAVFGLVYTYVGYPLLTVIVGRLRNRGVKRGDDTPPLSLIVAAFNEEDVIRDRLVNALASDYPADKIEIIVASDGSTDATNRIVSEFGDGRVRLLTLPRRGKIPALNDAVQEAQGDLLVFSDANTEFDVGTLRSLVGSFGDPEVGGVVGCTGYRVEDGSESSSRGEDLYWRYDTWLKSLESACGSVVSAHGGLYALRKGLYEAPPDPAVTDDFYISTGVVAHGKRLVFEPAARAYEHTVPKASREFGRRIRLMTRGLRSLFHRRRLLNPFVYGFYSVSLFSRKLLRRLQWFFLIVLLASTMVLFGRHPAFTAALGLQLAFYASALLGLLTRSSRVGRSKLLYVPFFFCMANVAAMLAFFRFLRGDRIAFWSPQRHAEVAQGVAR